MHAGGSHADEHVPILQVVARDDVLLVHHTHRETGQIVLFLRHQPRMLRCLASDQSCARLAASLSHTADNRRDLLGIILAAGYVIQEKQRLAAGAGHVVDAHGNAVDADGVMLVQKKRQLDFGAHAIRSGQKHRLVHLFDGG